MSKPLGLGFEFDDRGMPRFRVSSPSCAEDAVWTAVEQAIEHGWTVDRFKNEASEAWAHVLREQAKHAASEWRKP